MNKKIVVALLLSGVFYLTNQSRSYSQAFTEQTTCFSAGYGAGTFVTSLLTLSNGLDKVNGTQAGPLYLKVEKGVSDHVGFGINFAYLYNQWTYSEQLPNTSGTLTNYSSTESRAAYSIMGRFNFHFGSNEKFDPYLGFGLGYRNAIWKSITNDPNNPLANDIGTSIPFPFAFEATAGAKYLLSPNFALYIEAGFAKSAVQGGAVFNLPGSETANSQHH